MLITPFDALRLPRKRCKRHTTSHPLALRFGRFRVAQFTTKYLADVDSGSESRNSTAAGTLYPVRCKRLNAITFSALSDFSRGTTKTFTRSPTTGSGTPIRVAGATSNVGWGEGNVSADS